MSERISTGQTEAVRRLFDELVERSPDERAERLSALEDAALRNDVRSLLDAHEDAARRMTDLEELHALFAPPRSAPDLRDQTDPHDMVGQTVGRYAVEDHLGGGGMGVIYRARDTKLDRLVALKFLSPHLAARREAKQRFIREAKAASALDAPSICTIHDISETEAGQLFLAMAYYPGETLKKKIDRGPRAIEEVVDYAIQIGEGLSKAHAAGIVHRDVKPANVLITDDGYAKLLDFGLAKLGDARLTQTGRVLGTVAYVSPEQARGKTVDHRTDLWALGVMLYEMLTGERPFRGARHEVVLYSILNEAPQPIKQVDPAVPSDLEQIVDRTLQKTPAARYGSTAEMVNAMKAVQDRLHAAERPTLNRERLLRHLRAPRVAIPVAGAFLLLLLTLVWFFNHRAKVDWAREEALPEIERLVETSWRDYTDAYQLAQRAEQYIPNDPKLAALMAQSSLHIDIDSEPPGANVYMKEYANPESAWQEVGITPIDSLRVPIGIFRWKMEKDGYEPVLAAASTWDVNPRRDSLLLPNHIARTLDERGHIPDGMVRVPGAETAHGKLNDFFIDQYEVTNEDYKVFIDSGGYRNRDYWHHEVVTDGQVLTWEAAMAKFVDQTGQPGPASWQAGDYPEGQGNYPVSGISWYEAAAYAVFAGKRLPTSPHWGLARGEKTPWIQFPQLGGGAVFAPAANIRGNRTIEGNGPVPVGHLPSITSYGAYDMAGNVREWGWNETAKGRVIRGGAWNDNPYMFAHLSQAPPFDRSNKNGFRCVLYPDREAVPNAVFKQIQLRTTSNLYAHDPVSDAVFQVYKDQFSYDPTDLNARIESRDKHAEDWIHERITVDAAYNDERLILHLFLPKNSAPPYQTVIYVPGSGSFVQESSKDIEQYYEFSTFLSFLVKNGRAILYPAYKGTFERQDPDAALVHGGKDSHLYTEYLIKWGKDFKRSIDYLETRPEINSDKLAYYGMSWGGMMGAIIPAVEPRLEASILAPGVLRNLGLPEANGLNYIRRVTLPTLMLNGRFDTIAPLETNIRPMYDLLGTPEEHKTLKLYDTDHIPPRNEYIKEMLAWLDRYLGPVEYE